MAAQQQQERFITALSVRALLMQQKMSDPANCMDGCDWADEAVAMYTKGLWLGRFG